MNIRDFGTRSGFKVPQVSMGAMRFPADDDAAVELIRHAIDSGMVYIDTCRCYGDSELKLAKALKDGYREKVVLSTKWSPWIKKIEDDDAPTADCVRKRIEESMTRLEVDYLDFYQVWNIMSEENLQQATAKGGMVEGILKAMDEGLVGHTGFTTHDKPERLVSYLPTLDWCEIMLVSYNLLNTTYAPVLAKAHELGIGTICMNPVGGGRLAEASPVLLEVAEGVGATSVAELAVRYVLSNPNVDTIISGISKPSDVQDTLLSAETGPFTEDQLASINAFLLSRERANASFCTECGYCTPCPQGINIPALMTCVYHDRYWGLSESVKKQYAAYNGPKADACAMCGECEEKCTQELPIRDEMKYAHQRFGE